METESNSIEPQMKFECTRKVNLHLNQGEAIQERLFRIEEEIIQSGRRLCV